MKTAINVLIIFNLIVFFHEMGHFVMARKHGVRVIEFALGMGPALISKEKGETTYSIRMLPLGGFCKMEGEDEESQGERSFGDKSPWQRLSIILAGPVMNFVLTIILLIGLNTYTGYPIPVVGEVIPNSPAAEVGLEKGDLIEAINDEPIQSWEDMVRKTRETTGEMKLSVVRTDQSKETILVEPMDTDGVRQIGVYPGRDHGVFRAAAYSFKQMARFAQEFMHFFGRLFRGQVSSADVAGPIGLVKTVDDVTKSGFEMVVFFTAFFSMNLGVINLLPIPALDGGRLIFILIEILRGKPLDPEKEGMVHLIGFVFLMALMLFVTFLDIQKWMN